MVKMQNFVLWMHTALEDTENKMLKQDLTLHILNQTDNCLKEKRKK